MTSTSGGSKASTALTSKSSKPKPLPPIPNRSSVDPQLESRLQRLEKREKKVKKKMKKEKKNGAPESLWDLAGTLLPMIGQKAIDYIIPLLVGFGDYEVNTNSLVAQATHGDNGYAVPIMRNSKVANIFRHREFIGNVVSSTSAFAHFEYDINPGLDKTFPWAASLMNNYTNYRMRGLVFEFVSEASSYAAGPSLGYVAMATQYNPYDNVFTDKKAMLNSEYANSGRPSENLLHPIECAGNQISVCELTVRNRDLPSWADKRLYDIGRFTIAVGGQSVSDVVIGELWATYELEAYFPRLGQTLTPMGMQVSGIWFLQRSLTLSVLH